ncbi:unnamed protein product [Brassica oleracea var. botrytis]
MYDTGDWDFKLDSDRMGRAVYAKLITSVEDLKRAIIESYGLVGMSVAVEMSYWLGEHGSCVVGEREAPVQISKDKDFDLFTSARKVDKYINVFVTFKEEIDGKIHFLRPMGNLLKSKEVASSNEMQVGSTSADVHTRNEVNDGETDLTEDEIILMGVVEIEAVYASNGFGMREVDGTACEVQNKVETTEDAALGEGEDANDEDYDYNLWHDFVGRNCEWDDDKDEDGGVGGGGRTNVTYGGVRGEVVTKTRSGRTNPSSNKGSGSSTNKQRTANPPSTFEDYVDEGRRYYTCDYVNDGDCHVHKWWDEAVMEEMRARDTHTLQLSEKVDYLTFWNDYDPQLNKFKDLQNETEQKLVRLEKIVSELAENRTRLTNGFEYFVGGMNDGLHIRHDCLTALEEELDCLRSQYAEEVSLRRELQFELAQMREEIKELKQLTLILAFGKMTVAKYKRFFYNLPIVGERTEQQLILLAKAGLKEEIRDGLETEEFATLEALFEEAEEVEEGLKETPPSSPRKRRRTSPDHRSSKRARKAERKGDPEDEGYGYPGEEETGLKDDEEGDYWEWMQMDTDVDDDASD